MYTNSLKSYFYSTTFHNFVTQSGRLNRLTNIESQWGKHFDYVCVKTFCNFNSRKSLRKCMERGDKRAAANLPKRFYWNFFFDIDTHWRPHGKRDSFLPSAITNANFWYFDDFSKIKVFHFSIASWILWSSHSFWEVFYETRTFYF